MKLDELRKRFREGVYRKPPKRRKVELEINGVKMVADDFEIVQQDPIKIDLKGNFQLVAPLMSADEVTQRIKERITYNKLDLDLSGFGVQWPERFTDKQLEQMKQPMTFYADFIVEETAAKLILEQCDPEANDACEMCAKPLRPGESVGSDICDACKAEHGICTKGDCSERVHSPGSKWCFDHATVRLK